jgi:anti-anti-sigma factor
MTAVDAVREPVRVPAQATLSVLSQPACTIASLEGELDIATVPELRERLFGVLSPGVRLLIIDLSGVSFCDVAGLAVLIGTQRRATVGGIAVRVAAPQPQVAKLLHLTGLDRRLTIGATLADALPTDWREPPTATSPTTGGPGRPAGRVR